MPLVVGGSQYIESEIRLFRPQTDEQRAPIADGNSDPASNVPAMSRRYHFPQIHLDRISMHVGALHQLRAEI